MPDGPSAETVAGLAYATAESNVAVFMLRTKPEMVLPPSGSLPAVPVLAELHSGHADCSLHAPRVATESTIGIQRGWSMAGEWMRIPRARA